MALIDRDKLLVCTGTLIANLRATAGNDPILQGCINLLQTQTKLIAKQEPVDPIHHAGGCYCRECKSCLLGRCLKKNFQDVSPNGFCDEGRQREEDANGRVE